MTKSQTEGKKEKFFCPRCHKKLKSVKVYTLDIKECPDCGYITK